MATSATIYYIDGIKTFIMFAFSMVYWLQGNPRRWC